MIVAILALALLSGLMIVLGIGLLHLGMGALEDKLPGSLRRKPEKPPEVMRVIERPSPHIDWNRPLSLNDDGELPHDFDADPQRVAWTRPLRGLRRPSDE